MWDIDEVDGETWEYIYLLDDVRPLSFSYEVFNHAAGYAPTNIIQGFSVLSEDRSANIIAGLELFSDVQWAVAPETNLETIIDREFDAPDALDKTVTSIARAEQGYHRRRLLRERLSAECDICGKEFPADLLRAAHIKKRAQCDRRERLDPAVVMLACNLGCDALYENGYIVVVDRIVRRSGKPAGSPDAAAHLSAIEGHSCNAWSESSAKFFGWHSDLYMRII